MQSAVALEGDGQLDKLERASRYRLQAGRDVVAALQVAIDDNPAHGSINAARVSAALVRSCCDNSNAWVGSDLQTGEGELFDSAGSLTSCGERLCPNCLRKRSAQSRRRARRGVENASEKLAGLPGLRWRFITLTFPTIPANDLPLLDALSLVQNSWRKLSRSQWWRDNVRAVVKGVEFTLGDEKRISGGGWDSAVEGYHAHVHLLVSSHWLNARELSFHWTAAVKMQMALLGLIAPRGTREGRYFADIKEVSNSNERSGFTSLARAVLEVAKYITKSDSWSRLPASQLLAVAAIERWPRMFELGGACRMPVVKTVDPFAADSESIKACRDEMLLAYGPYFDYDALVQTRAWNKSATTRAEVLANHIAYALERWKRVSGWLPLTSIYTESLSGGELNKGSPVKEKEKRLSMKSKGLALLRDGNLHEFESILRHWLREAREFRLRQLRLRYPFAEFWLIAIPTKGSLHNVI